MLDMFRLNIILNADSYKTSHFMQYPPGTEHIYSYIEPRKGHKDIDYIMFFGLQAFLKEYLSVPITRAMIRQGREFWLNHGMPFNEEGWEIIFKEYGGYLPVEIEAIPEGMKVPVGTPVVQVHNTDPRLPWLTSYVETAILRAVWYSVTVATKSKHLKNLILASLVKSSDDPATGINFKLHDFGFRGVSSFESGAIGGMAHLVNFMGSDTSAGVLAASVYYDEPMAAFSIPAAEHSTITSWGETGECAAFENMINKFGGKFPLIAVVSDSYDLERAVHEYWGKNLKNKVLVSNSMLVVRPDSGDPTIIPVETVANLAKHFGYTTNSKGFKVLNNVRVIQGDGIDLDSIPKILENLLNAGWSADNLAFGMGGALLQSHTRDDFGFAMKANAIKLADREDVIDVYKNPKTDTGKRSKKGIQAVYKNKLGRIISCKLDDLPKGEINLLQPVWRNGRLLKEYTFAQIRALSNEL